jgi:hypothetical protein
MGIVFSAGQSPLLILGIISISLGIINFLEWNKCRKKHD